MPANGKGKDGKHSSLLPMHKLEVTHIMSASVSVALPQENMQFKGTQEIYSLAEWVYS